MYPCDLPKERFITLNATCKAINQLKPRLDQYMYRYYSITVFEHRYNQQLIRFGRHIGI
jgi:hypothetical protein